jgi:uncharacterized protein (DUF302 family)
MSYYFSTTLEGDFDEIVDTVTDELKKEGFGVLTKIDVKQTLKAKLQVDFENYTILGACNPTFAYEALRKENKIGTMLPCNVIVRKTAKGMVEVAAIDPIASMASVQNDDLKGIAAEVQTKLKKVIDNL